MPHRTAIFRRAVLGFAIATCILLLPMTARAHELTEGVGTQSTITIFEDRIGLEVNLGYSAAVGFESLRRIDSEHGDGDWKIEKSERQAFLEVKGPALAKDLHLVVNGRRLTLVLKSMKGAGMLGEVASVPFDTFFFYEAKLPPALPDDGGWWLHSSAKPTIGV